MTQALDIISTEHRSMWQLTVMLEELCKHIADPAHKPDAGLFDQILDYIEQYVERVHEPKEETYLYRAVLERSSEGDDMIAQFKREHAGTTEAVAGLRARMKAVVRHHPAGAAEFRQTIEDYIAMMRRYIMKEESDLFLWRAGY